LTIFLNDKGVYAGSTVNADEFAAQQTTMATLIEKGAGIFICPMCMEQYGIDESDLLPGLKMGDPAAIGAALFQPNTRTLSY
jgi:sulfur relay (sulfurtransferase) complex TusBCD TusD component (DsrE family)